MDHTITGCEQSRRDQLQLQEELSKQNRDLRETRIKRFHEMEDLKRVQELRRRLIENQDTINELTARIQELQNEVSCLNDSRDFKDAESVRSGPSHVPSHPGLLPPYRDPGGLLSRNNQPPDIWNTRQSGPSARNSFDPKKGRSSKDYGADQQRVQISELHFDKFPTPTKFARRKIRFKTEVCTCSQFPTEAMQWIKEVELVDSVDDLKSSR